MKMNKKGFIFGWPVMVLVLFGFLLTYLVFFFLFSIDKSDQQKSIEDSVGIAEGNYFAQFFLKSEVLVSGDVVNIAELLALIEHNQSRTPSSEIIECRIIRGNTLLGSLSSRECPSRNNYLGRGYNAYIRADQNNIFNILKDQMDVFVHDAMDQNTCYYVIVITPSFEYGRLGSACEFRRSFSFSELINELAFFPYDNYKTTIPNIDPTKDNIDVYVITDVNRLIIEYAWDYLYSISFYYD